MKLVIVESPAKTKTIKKYLGKDFTVKASVGHIRDLPKSAKTAIDIKAGFVPHYVVSPGKEKVVDELKKLSKKASETILATDPDREGEAIAWHIKEACGLKKPKRIVFHEITKSAVHDALIHPRTIDKKLLKAQEARRVLDRLFGYDLSALIWKKVRYGLSAGRVQSPALRIIMEREREIRAFVPEEYWTLRANLTTPKKELIEFTCVKEPRDKKETERILAAGRAGAWTVANVKETKAKRSPRPPFITSTLQQTASTRLGFSPARTMMFAQRLYEAGLITYMRTDSTILSKEAQAAIIKEVSKRYGKEYVSPRVFKTKSKSAQEAHEAIRPSNVTVSDAGTNAEQKKLYRLIWQRAIASQMSDAQTLKTRITANIESEDIPDFSANGMRVLFPGWLAADTSAHEEDTILPECAQGEDLDLQDINAEQKETQPPGHYSEAGLVKELEKRGIGRPSTYAPTIKTLIDRGYVEKEGRALHPTDTGDVVSTFIEDNFTDYISDSFTADMEDKLDLIAEGKAEYKKTLTDFYRQFSKDVASKADIEKLTTLGDADPKMKCPTCGGAMVIKLGRSGKFLSCAKFPDCEGARTIDGEAMEGPKETGEECPECNGKLVERTGKYGKFVACGNYPKCKYVKNEDENGNPIGGTGVACPSCGKGELAERKGRFGIFYGCSNYPTCRFAIKAKPTGKKCSYKKDDGSACGALMMEGTKTIPERCSDKACPNHNPHKLGK